MSRRDLVLQRIRAARERRDPVEHPGRFGAWRPESPPSPLDGFEAMFTQAGGEVARVESSAALDVWVGEFVRGFEHVSFGVGVPAELRAVIVGEGADRDGRGGEITTDAPRRVPPGSEDLATVGVCVARAAVAETGSLVMDSRDGRRAQLLPPVLVVLVSREVVHATLTDALEWLRDDLSAAVGLHSGPSKSADIGQVMVRGVHGPGRVVAVVV